MPDLTRVSTPREWAAILLAQGTPVSKVAADPRVNMAVSTVKAWLKDPDFRQEIEQQAIELREEMKKSGIASRDNRISLANEFMVRLQAFMEANTLHPELQDDPRIGTGLLKLVRTVVPLGGGRSEVYISGELDYKLSHELREWMKFVAQDKGDWTEKRAPASDPVMRSYVIVDAEKEQS